MHFLHKNGVIKKAKTAITSPHEMQAIQLTLTKEYK